MARQEARMKESSLIVFDLAKELHLLSLQPLTILLYVIGSLPAVPGILIRCGELGLLSFKPAQLDRDDLLTIVKGSNKLSKEDLKIIINVLADELIEDNFIKIGKLMQKFISTKRKEVSRDDASALRRIKYLGLSPTELTRNTKKSILKLWFSDIISGPLFITRSLDYIEFDGDKGRHASDLDCGVVNKLKKRVSGSSGFWCYRMNYVIVMDKNFFCISGAANEDMNYPLEVWTRYSYIGLRDFAPERYFQVKEKVVQCYQKHYLEGYDQEKCNVYRMLTVKNKQGKCRLKLHYGNSVFHGMMIALIREVNSLRFDLWCRAADGVGWTLWSGLDEQKKLKDYRNFNEKNKKLQRQVLKLKAALQEKEMNGRN